MNYDKLIHTCMVTTTWVTLVPNNKTLVYGLECGNKSQVNVQWQVNDILLHFSVKLNKLLTPGYIPRSQHTVDCSIKTYSCKSAALIM